MKAFKKLSQQRFACQSDAKKALMIGALIMTCCLMIYAALEHTIRQQLKARNLHFPDMKKEPTQQHAGCFLFSGNSCLEY